MSIIFDGREFARDKEKLLSYEVTKLKKKGIIPKLASILVGDDPASVLYVNLKKKAAERVGAELQVIRLNRSTTAEEIIKTIQQYNSDNNVHGIMVQLPLPKSIINHQSLIINSIAPEKDIDGLREDSPFVPATVKAILTIIDEATRLRRPSARRGKVCVVGAKGIVGKPLVKLLRKLSYKVTECDIDTMNYEQITMNSDILISATGVPNLIKGDMVKDGAIVIDVGSPKGDVDPSAALRASFITPVPGGVGPVTIVSLLDNLVSAAV